VSIHDNQFYFFATQDAEDEEDDDDKKKDKDKDKKKDGKDGGKGQAHHMFSRFLNLRICFMKFTLFCFPVKVEVFYGDKKCRYNCLS
jgi:hypothetical protein